LCISWIFYAACRYNAQISLRCFIRESIDKDEKDMDELKQVLSEQHEFFQSISQISLDFDARILEEQLRRKRKPYMIGTGAMCDPYIHLEEELQITLTTYDEDLCRKIEPEISTTAQWFAVLEQMRSLWTMQRFSSA
jgi:DNA repair photolyase